MFLFLYVFDVGVRLIPVLRIFRLVRLCSLAVLILPIRVLCVDPRQLSSQREVYTTVDMPSPLADPVKLPCGLVLPNRLSKVSITDLDGLCPQILTSTGGHGRTDVQNQSTQRHTPRRLRAMVSRWLGQHSNRYFTTPPQPYPSTRYTSNPLIPTQETSK